MLPEGWQNVQRILVIQADVTGDLARVHAALQSLRQALPKAEIVLMVAGSPSTVTQPTSIDQIWSDGLTWNANSADSTEICCDRQWIDQLQNHNFDAAIVFTDFGQSPYPFAYLCYLAGIPIRVGLSQEFGGGVLSDWVKPPKQTTPSINAALFLLKSVGLAPEDQPEASLTIADAVARGIRA